MNTNTIGYSGKVSITKQDTTLYSSHNAGTNSLFNLLCSLLAVSQSNHDCYPAYISIISGNVASNTTQSPDNYKNFVNNMILVSEIIITNKVITTSKNDTTSTLKLSGLLTYDNIKSLQPSINAYSILLLDSTKTRILAYADISSKDSENLAAIKHSKLNQASVNWELTFANT